VDALLTHRIPLSSISDKGIFNIAIYFVSNSNLDTTLMKISAPDEKSKMNSIQLTIDNKELEIITPDQYGNYHVKWHHIGIGYIYVVGFGEDASPIWSGSTILLNSYAAIIGGFIERYNL
jgi:hypothetical protein